MIPPRPADRSEQNGISMSRALNSRLGKRPSCFVEGNSPDWSLGNVKAQVIAPSYRVEDLHPLRDDFWADAIARKEDDLILRWH
jgi:hypothetical protein